MTAKNTASDNKKKPAKKSSAANKSAKKKKSDVSQQLFIPYMILFIVAVLAGIVLLRGNSDQDYEVRSEPRTIEDLITAPEKHEDGGFDLQVALQLILWDIGLDLRRPKVSKRDGIRNIALDTSYPESEQINALERAVAKLPGNYHVASDEVVRTIRILDADGPQLLLEFTGIPPSTDKRPKIALIVDDLGRDLRSARRLLALESDLTFSILPSEAYARQVAELVHDEGREILIHLPMEPQGYPEKNPGDDALMVGMDEGVIRGRMDVFLSQVPYAVGGNNHMGSRFTEDQAGMQVVIDYLRGANLFFIDSLTSHRSVAMETARSGHVPTAVRDVFLDNEADVDAIVRQLHKLVRIAEKRGRAIGICHPYPETLAALEQEIALLKSDDLEVVPVSRLLLR